MKTAAIFLTLMLTLVSMSCSPKFDISKHFDPSLPLKIIDQYPPSPVRMFEIGQNDPRHTKLASWLKSNKQGWKKTDHDTHAGLIIVNQDDFVILLYRDNDFVIVGINAEGNEMEQYKLNTDSNELLFLVKN